jgi:pimeloyl-ACP methyl ester carboxylesterase
LPRLELNGQSISYRREGSGHPFTMLVHCAGGSSLYWAEVMRLLAGRGGTVVALDLPGHGNSPPFDPPPPVSGLLERYRDMVVDMAEQLGLGRFTLVGHSMGGAVAQHVALACPDRLAHLVLVATAASLRVAPAVMQTIRHRFDQLPDLMAALGFSVAGDADQIRSWAKSMIQAPRMWVLADFLACDHVDLRGRIREVRCPTTIISGADDRLTPPRLQQRLAELMRGSRLETLTRAGHFLVYERPRALARLIPKVG